MQVHPHAELRAGSQMSSCVTVCLLPLEQGAQNLTRLACQQTLGILSPFPMLELMVPTAIPGFLQG